MDTQGLHGPGAAVIRRLLTPAARIAVAGMLVSLACGIKIAAPPNQTIGFEVFNRANFDAASANITNSWLAMQVGTRFVLEGIVVERGVDVPRHMEITTTNLTKVISGVETRVVYLADYNAGHLVEAALTFLAQDKGGNVWRMGEYPEEYVSGELIAAPAWIHGLENAVAGVFMVASPVVGADYSQGWAPGVAFTDRGKVDQVGVQFCPQQDVCYDNVLVIAEYAPGEIGEQLKYFARGIGYISEAWRGEGDKAREKLDLVEVQQLVPAAMRSVCEAVRALDASGRENSVDVYGQSAILTPTTCP